MFIKKANISGATLTGKDPTWNTHFDNTQWAPVTCFTWTGSAWQVNCIDPIELGVTGSWYVGLRPTHIRMTATSGASPWTFDLRDSNDGVIATISIPSGTSTTGVGVITFGSFDIGNLYDTQSPNGSTIDNIEFFYVS